MVSAIPMISIGPFIRRVQPGLHTFYARCELQKVVQPSMRNASMQFCPGIDQKKKPLRSFDLRGSLVGSLAVTYSGMPERHTTIGAERFHFRVRNGIGWYPLAMAARQTF